MTQERYINKVLDKLQMSDCKCKSTPSELKLDDENEHETVDPTMYREAVGSLVYAMICTRPDICWAITKLSQHLSRPLKVHWIAVKHVLRYLKGTLKYKLWILF